MHQNFPSHWTEHDKKIRPYLWGHRIVNWTESLVELTLVIWFVFSGLAQNLEKWVASIFSNELACWLMFYLIIGVAWKLAAFPFSVASYRIERHFALSKQSFRAWLWDFIKGMAIGVILGGIVLVLLYFCIHWFREKWWLVACTLLVLFSVVLAQLTPVIFIPLFFVLKPLEDGPLKKRLLDLCARFHISVKDIFHLGMGEKTEKGNAAFVGLGKTKKIMIGDTLYQKFSEDEVEAVFAHELGHQVHGDLLKGILFSSIALYVAFFIANLVMVNQLTPRFGINISSPSGFFVFGVVLSFLQVPIGFLQTVFSRWCEKNADAFAKTTLGSGERLAIALERLTIQNHGQFYPHTIIEFFTHSHPAPWRRIARLR